MRLCLLADRRVGEGHLVIRGRLAMLWGVKHPAASAAYLNQALHLTGAASRRFRIRCLTSGPGR